MLDYAKSDPTAMPVMRDIFVRNMDWPGADQLADRLKKTIPPQYLSDKEREAEPQQIDPAQAAANQLQLAEAQAKVAKATADAQRAQAEVEKTVVETQARKIETQIAIAQANKPQANGHPAPSLKIVHGQEAVDLSGHPQPTAGGLAAGLAQGLAALAQSLEAGNERTVQAIAAQARRRSRRADRGSYRHARAADWRSYCSDGGCCACRRCKHGHRRPDYEPAPQDELEREVVLDQLAPRRTDKTGLLWSRFSSWLDGRPCAAVI